MGMSSTAFSSSAEEVIGRKLGTSHEGKRNKRKNDAELRAFYEVDRCIKFITHYGRVALQFPDHLLADSAAVVAILEREGGAGKEMYILGDTSYGSCCVDEVSAEHAQAECIIHFGSSCLMQTRRLPVLYVFGQEGADVPDCEDRFKDLFPDTSEPVLVLCDPVFSHCAEALLKQLSCHGYVSIVPAKLLLPLPVVQTAGDQPKLKDEESPTGTCPCSGSVEGSMEQWNTQQCYPSGVGERGDNEATAAPLCESELRGSMEEHHSCTREHYPKTIVRCGRQFTLSRPLTDHKVFYIGGEGPCLTNLLLNISECEFYSYCPETRETRKESSTTNKMLGRRYFLVQKAKEAKAVGILVGTLGAADYLPMIERLKQVLHKAGKKYYTVSVGKLNPAKLANFMEVDIFVLVACPQCSLQDSQEFYQPIVTPFEMEVACLSCREWNGRMVTDYRQLLQGGASHVSVEEGVSEREDEPHFSFISGSMLQLASTAQAAVSPEEAGAVVPRQGMDLALPHSASYLLSRSWHGLEQRLGETPVSDAVEGRSGVATAYSHETS